MRDDAKTKMMSTVSHSDLTTSIESFRHPLGQYLTSLNLPVQNVLASVTERKKVIESLASAIEAIPYGDRQKAHYLTKFTVAVSMGLFDGALNYLWDETILALRRLVQSFDLQYFYAVAEQISPRAKKLELADELPAISDHDLLE